MLKATREAETEYNTTQNDEIQVNDIEYNTVRY